MAGRRSAPSVEQAPRVQIPKLITDPVWSLRPWPVQVTIGPLQVQIPALPAADWLAVLMANEIDPEDIFPGLLEPEDMEAFEDALYAGEFGLDEYNRTFFEVIETVAARPWWVTLRLIGVVRDEWAVIGADLLAKVDASALSLSGWLDVALASIMAHIEPESATMFTLQLEMPPPREVAKVQQELEMSPAEFMALAG